MILFLITTYFIGDVQDLRVELGHSGSKFLANILTAKLSHKSTLSVRIFWGVS
jgi:hypothetical protein